MYVCVYVYIYIICIYTYVPMCSCMYIRMFVCMYVCMQYVCIYVCICICIHTHTHTHTHTHAYIYRCNDGARRTVGRRQPLWPSCWHMYGAGTTIYVFSYYYMCPRTLLCVLVHYYMCPRTLLRIFFASEPMGRRQPLATPPSSDISRCLIKALLRLC
jgi:hypothetical protein